MIIMPVPKDVRTFKPKFIGPFSKREFLGVAGAIAIAVVFFAITSSFMADYTLTQRGTIILIPASIPLACGFVDIQGMPIWVFVKELIIQKFLAPKHRLYATNNIYQEYAIRNKITMEYLDDEPATTPAQKRKKKKEYAQSLKKFEAGNPDFESFA